MANLTPRITVGLAAAGRVEWTMATIQSLNLYHPLLREMGEILVIDNAPELTPWIKNDRPCQHGDPEGMQALEAHCRGVPNCRYEVYTDKRGTAAPRQRIFERARGDIVLVIDAHVFVAPGAIERLLGWFEYYGEESCRDLLQGPWVYDGCDPRHCQTHMEPVWRSGMFGIWGRDSKVDEPLASFTIPMQGLGLFACLKKAWPGFSPHFKEFGGEEGYIHEKFRRNGGYTQCCPWLGWWHCFKNTQGVQYRISDETKLWNYIVGAAELKHPPEHPMSLNNAMRHFCEELKTVSRKRAGEMALEVERLFEATPVGLVQPGVNAEILEKPTPLEPVKINSEAVARDIVQTLKAVPKMPGYSDSESPWVYCLMATHGRATLAKQAVECFLRQDYPKKMLYILNTGESRVVDKEDEPAIVMEFHYPGWFVDSFHNDGVSLKWAETGRLPTVDELVHHLAAQTGQECLVHLWDDDDLYLPWCLSQAVAHLREDQLAWKPLSHYYEQSGHMVGLTQNMCESSVLFRREVLRDNAKLRIRQICEMLIVNGGMSRRDLGPWSGYLYRFGISPDHYSGRDIPPADSDEMQARLRLFREKHRDFDGTPGPDSTLLNLRRIAGFAYPFGQELLKRIDGEPPGGPLAGLPRTTIQGLLDYKFPDRTNLVAMEIGRTSTAELVQQVRIKKIHSVDPDVKTLVAAQEACGPMSTKVNWLGDIPDCGGCQGINENLDLVLFNQPNPMQVLQAYRDIQRVLSDVVVMVVPNWKETGAALLLRCVLEPHFVAEEVGAWLVFSPRSIPEWQLHRPKERPV